MIRRFTSAPKPRPASRHHLDDVGVSPGARQPVPDAVVTRQVRRALGGGDQVVRRQGVVGVRQRDLADRAPSPSSRSTAARTAPAIAGLDPLAEALGDHAHPQAFDAAAPARPRSRGPAVERRRVARVVAGDAPSSVRGVAHVARERADRGRATTRTRSGRTATTRPYVGFSPTTPQSEAGCRTEPPVSVPSAQTASPAGHRRRRPAGRPAGHAVEVPRVVYGSERRVLVRRAHRELVAVRLADQHGAGPASRAHGVESYGGTNARGSSSRRSSARRSW